MDAAVSPVAGVVRSELAAYIRHLASRVERMVGALPEDRLWVKPFPFGNSVGNLVLHLTGNLSHYVGARIGGSSYVRDRPREFADPGGYPAAEILGRFREAVEMVVGVIESRTDEQLVAPMADDPPVRTVFGLLLVVAAHLNNHIGQMSYLLQAHQVMPSDPPSW
jgi:hypothetical protein